jgi:MFS family permease
VAKLFVDIGPLRRYPQYRRLWIGYAISAIGSQLTIAAVAFQVYLITRSNFDVGLVSLLQLAPAILAPMVGGSIADAFDRRKVLVVTAIAMAACSIALAVNAQSGHARLWPLYLVPAISQFFQGISGPTSTATQMTLVDKDSIVAANVLRQMIQRLALVVGPTLAGILIATGGVRLTYWFDALSFVFAVGAVATLQPLPPQGGARRFGFKSIVEGFAFLKGRKVIQACFLADFNATVLGLPTSLFPALAASHFGHHLSNGDIARIYGLLVAGPGIGALVGSLLSGWTTEIRRQGLAVLLAVGLWGAALAAFGLVHVLWLAIFLLAVAGWADLVSASFRNTIIQVEAPDRLRGRLSAISTTVVGSGPRLGNFEAGTVAKFSSVEWSIVSGGLGVILGVLLIAKRFPSFARYELGAGEEEVVTTS